MPSQPAQTWTLDSQPAYTVSDDRSLIDMAAPNDAFDSKMLYWNSRVEEEQLQQIVDASLCLGLYFEAASGQKRMVGFARLITDYSTFGYLTDFYVLPTHQGKGLAKWMMAVLDEIHFGWPLCKRLMLVTNQGMCDGFYTPALKGLKEFDLKHKGRVVMMKSYPGAYEYAFEQEKVPE